MNIHSTVLELHQKRKSILSEIDFEYKFPFFLKLYVVFPGAVENY